MIIQSIKWNGRVMDVTHIGQKTGTKYVYHEETVSQKWMFGDSTRKFIRSIVEVTPTVYDIHYRINSEDKIQRIFNPIEVNYIEEKNE